MKATSLILVSLCTVTGFWWGLSRNRGAQFTIQLESLHQQEDELARLRREHERLSRLAPSDEELARLRGKPLIREAVAAAVPDETASKPSLQPGVWASPAQWQNRGQATPEAALETVLWAAAGGDLLTLKATLAFDEASLAQAAALVERQPGASRTTPEELLALTIAGNIPLESVQAVTQLDHSADEVIQYARMKNPAGETRQVYLTLQRTPAGWKLRVPASAVNAIVRGR